MSFTHIKNSFISGELSPAVYGRTDLAKLPLGATTYRNFFAGYRGGAYSRAGLAYVCICKQPATAAPPRPIPFQFNNEQGFMLEFGDNYMRIVSNGAYVTETAQNVTGITQANLGVITIASHGYANGDWVYASGIGGMTAFNGLTWIVANKTTNTFTLTDLFGNPVNTNVMPAYTSGGTFARIYTLATPYAAIDLPWLKFVQSADTMTLDCVNPNTLTGLPAVEYPSYNLVRNGATSWTLTEISYASPIAAPQSCSATAQASTTEDTYYSYVVTAVDGNGNESVASNAGVVLNNDISVNAGSNTITWSPVSGASYYNVYKATPSYNAPVPIGVNFGFLGQSFGTSFVDTNIEANFTQTPPTHQDPFARGQITGVTIMGAGSGQTQANVGYTISTSTGSGFAGSPIILSGALVGFLIENNGKLYAIGDTITITDSDMGAVVGTATLVIGAQSGTYPSVPTYLFQRAVQANTLNNPDDYFMSKPGQYLNMDSSIPITDGDAIIGNPWAQQVNGIQWMIPMLSAAVTFTGGGTWLLSGGGGVGTPFTPTSQQATPQEYNGSSSTVPPIPVNSEILYVQSLGSVVRDASYNYFTQRLTSVDITVLSSHLFEGHQIVQWAYAQNPFYLVWVVRDDGTALSLTFIKEQEVQAWTRHDTDGLFVGVCSVTEPPVNAVYWIVKRYLNGNWYYVSERFDNRLWQNVEDSFCVDAGLSYPMTEPAATLTPASANGTSNISATQVIEGGYYPNQDAVATAVDSTQVGNGAAFNISYSGTAISAVTPVNQGKDYTPGQTEILITSPTGGSGAVVSPIITNIVAFNASASVFTSTMVGDVIRAGNGKATITSYVSGTEVMANITQPITLTVPNDPNNNPIPQTSGNWTISTPTTEVTGLNHLIGKTVAILADGGVVQNQQVVSLGNGNIGITLPVAASAITVGLPFLPQLQDTYLDPPGPTTAQSKRKSINAVAVRVENTAGISVGCNQEDQASTPGGGDPVWSNMTTLKMRNASVQMGQPIELATDDFYLPVQGGWDEKAQVAFQQSYPLPANISAVIVYYNVGDTSS